MPRGDDNDFRPRFRRGRGGARDGSFVSQALRAAGPGFAKSLGHLGRGRVAARAGVGRPGPRARRVIVKARLVVQPGRLKGATLRHARYLEREPASEPGHRPAYGPETDASDLDALAERSAGDRHQFRFIVAPEDGVDLDDLPQFTRTLMSRVERDLQTPLDWVAVDHWDTDNPHTHILLRGKTGTGQDLVIDRDYISHGLRFRAQELATEWLGPRTDREIQATQSKDLQADRLTPLDRTLQREAADGGLDLRETPASPAARRVRVLKLGRLAHLAKLGLADELRPGRWQLRPDAEATLRALGERGDIVRLVQQILGPAGNDLAIFSPGQSPPVTGAIVARGLSDELTEQGYLLVQGTDGRTHYLRLTGKPDLGEFPVGGIVRASGPRVSLESALPLARQTNAIGATWLDARLVGDHGGLDTRGFGAEVRTALAVRAEFLIGEGLAERRDGQLRVDRDLLPRLRNRELVGVAAGITARTGMTYRPVPDGQRAGGRYRQAMLLVSGKYALMSDGVGFSLVPWQPGLERARQRGIGR